MTSTVSSLVRVPLCVQRPEGQMHLEPPVRPASSASAALKESACCLSIPSKICRYLDDRCKHPIAQEGETPSRRTSPRAQGRWPWSSDSWGISFNLALTKASAHLVSSTRSEDLACSSKWIASFVGASGLPSHPLSSSSKLGPENIPKPPQWHVILQQGQPANGICGNKPKLGSALHNVWKVDGASHQPQTRMCGKQRQVAVSSLMNPT